MTESLIFSTMHVVRACGEYYKDKPEHEQTEWGRDVLDYLKSQKALLKHYDKATDKNYTLEEMQQEFEKFLADETQLTQNILEYVGKNRESLVKKKTNETST